MVTIVSKSSVQLPHQVWDVGHLMIKSWGYTSFWPLSLQTGQKQNTSHRWKKVPKPWVSVASAHQREIRLPKILTTVKQAFQDLYPWLLLDSDKALHSMKSYKKYVGPPYWNSFTLLVTHRRDYSSFYLWISEWSLYMCICWVHQDMSKNIFSTTFTTDLLPVHYFPSLLENQSRTTVCTD